MKRITLKDIANKMNVSTMTVSKALNNKPDISIELKNRIIDTAISMGYKTNNNQTASSYNFIFIITDRFFFETDQFYSAIYQSISDLCYKNGCSLSIEIIRENMENTFTIPENILNKKAHGIFMVGEVSTEYLSKILSLSIPTVCIDFYKDEFPDLCYILTDNITSGYDITKYLISLGHKHLGFIGNATFSSSIRDRKKGFLKALEEFNIKKAPTFFDRTDELLIIQKKYMPTAIFATSDGEANMAVKTLATNGYAIPAEISVAGFDNIPLSKLGLKDLTTVNVDKVKMGQLGFESLYNMVTKQQKCKTIQLGTELIIRDSTWICSKK